MRSQQTRYLLLLLLLLWGILDSTVAFAGAGFGATGGKSKLGSNKKQRRNKKSGSKTQKPASSPEKKTILLGPDRSVNIWVPPNVLEDDRQQIAKFTTAAASSSLLDEYGTYRGTGDVIWPSAYHLARLIANCPSFVSDRRVLDLGCGLGLTSLASILGRPTSLTLSDIDESVLDWAMKSCTEELDNNPTNNIPLQRLAMDWSNSSTWMVEKGTFDVVLASDVLYDEDAADHVATLVSHALLSRDDDNTLKRALVVDPSNRPNREAFVTNLAKHGLLAEPVPFPGQEKDFVLINVTPL